MIGDFLGYDRIRKEFAQHPVRRAELPIGYETSLPLPTKRFGRPAYAGFAGPAEVAPGGPLWLGAPDRWWAIDAAEPRLVLYALTRTVPFSAIDPAAEVLIPVPGRTYEQAEEDLAVLTELMTPAAEAFFGPGAPPEPDLAAVLRSVLPEPALDWYRALAPDFFAWLDGGRER